MVMMKKVAVLVCAMLVCGSLLASKSKPKVRLSKQQHYMQAKAKQERIAWELTKASKTPVKKAKAPVEKAKAKNPVVPAVVNQPAVVNPVVPAVVNQPVAVQPVVPAVVDQPVVQNNQPVEQPVVQNNQPVVNQQMQEGEIARRDANGNIVRDRNGDIVFDIGVLPQQNVVQPQPVVNPPLVENAPHGNQVNPLVVIGQQNQVQQLAPSPVLVNMNNDQLYAVAQSYNVALTNSALYDVVNFAVVRPADINAFIGQVIGNGQIAPQLGNAVAYAATAPGAQQFKRDLQYLIDTLGAPNSNKKETAELGEHGLREYYANLGF